MNLYNFCLQVLRENQDIDYFMYNHQQLRPLKTKSRNARIDDAAYCCNVEGEFEHKIIDEEYQDYDGTDDEGKPIVFIRTYKVCEIHDKKVAK